MSTEESSVCSSISGPFCCPDYGIYCKYLPYCRKIVEYLISEITNPLDEIDFRPRNLVLLNTDLDFFSLELYGVILRTKRTSALILTNGGSVVYRLKRRLIKLRLNLISNEWRVKFNKEIEETQELRELMDNSPW